MQQVTPRAAAGNVYTYGHYTRLTPAQALTNYVTPPQSYATRMGRMAAARRSFYAQAFNPQTMAGFPGGLHGLAADITTKQYVASGAGAATGAAQIATSHTVGGKIVGVGGIIASAAPLFGPAAPIVAIAGAVVAALGTVATMLKVGEGCGSSCILTSDWANQAEQALRTNIDAYFSSPAPRLTTSKEAALRGFDAIWKQLADACGKVTGAAGTNCTGDRQSGACHFHQTGESPWPGGPKIGECWNWFAAYRDPIANDAAITPEQAEALLVSSGGGSGAGNGGLNLGGTVLDSKTVLLLGGALLLIGAMGK